MVRLGLEPGAAGLKVLTNPLNYSGTPPNLLLTVTTKIKKKRQGMDHVKQVFHQS